MKRSVHFLLAICWISLQSCFEIVEQLTLKSDGSGNFQLLVNLSKSKTKINSFIKMGTVNGHKIPSKQDIRREVAEIESAAKSTPGITNVKTSIDFDNYIASIDLNFSKAERLNDILKNVTATNGASAKAVAKYFEYDATASVFTRSNALSLKEEYKKMSNADREIFAGAGFTAVYRFETPVVSRSNKKANVSPSKKAVMLKLDAMDLINNNSSLENRIKLAK